MEIKIHSQIAFSRSSPPFFLIMPTPWRPMLTMLMICSTGLAQELFGALRKAISSSKSSSMNKAIIDNFTDIYVL